jgi:hypothetical protein
MSGKNVVQASVTFRVSSSIRISVAPSPAARPGSSSSRATAAGRNNGSGLKSCDSRWNQSRGVGARHACHTALGEFEMLIPYLDGGYPPLDHFLSRIVADRNFGLHQIQLRDDRLMRAEIRESPNQDELRIRIGIDLQIEGIERLA